MPQHKHLPAITGFFTAALILSNLLDVKIFSFWGIYFPVGIIVFPISYVFGDILTEVYGYSASRRVVWTGFVSLLVTVALLEVAKMLPPAPFWQNQSALEALFAQTPRIMIGSMAAYFTGEFVNSYIVAKMKVSSGGKRMWGRFVASTLVGEFVDTAVFCLIAFLGTMPDNALLVLAFSAWVAKVVWEIIALPISLSLASWLKRVESEDYFDKNTNFNPFYLKD